MKTWQELLGSVRTVGSTDFEFGPHKLQVLSAIVVLQRARWYARVGTPSLHDDQVVRVASWEEAWVVRQDRDRYTSWGTLLRASEEVISHREHREPIQTWWRAARKVRLETLTVAYPPVLPGQADEMHSVSMDWPNDLLDRLFEEIIAQDETSCTYFRDQFRWLAYGYFPCGWEGDWPDGKMRVF